MILKYALSIALLSFGVLCVPTAKHLLGSKECTWGPSYWCQNLTSAHNCRAAAHCISTVWEHKNVVVDDDDICSICKRMVGEARDQLESNVTMEEMTEVFEGSCKLMYVKPAVKLCSKLVDEMVPELVDTISSQMNPDIVCSVAGLCNNAEIDEALDEFRRNKGNNDFKNMPKVKLAEANCNTCGKFFNQTVAKIEQTTSADLMDYMLDLCGKLSSYSDSCATIVLENFDEWETSIRSAKGHNEFCFVTGSCFSSREPTVGDQTCDFCQQIVLHFRDMMITDTSELEFKKVLKGLCNQTKKFASECNAIVDQYADNIYREIANDLDGKAICRFFNICPAPGVGGYTNGPIAPLLPVQPVSVTKTAVKIPDSSIKVTVVDNKHPTIEYGDPMEFSALPAELYDHRAPPSLHNDMAVNDQEVCVFCEYVLHYVQKIVTQPYGEKAVKDVVDKMCDELPHSISLQCRNFVSLYGDAFVAMFAQAIDPSQICPGLKVCPAEELSDHYKPLELLGKPGCPLCLMVIGTLEEQLENNKTADTVRTALDKVCEKLPKSLVKQCEDLVSVYTEQLVDMLVADFTPEEVCQYLKICKKPKQVEIISINGGTVSSLEENIPYEVLTNEIPDYSSKSEKQVAATKDKKDGALSSPGCILCEFIMEKLEEELKKPGAQDSVDKTLKNICSKMPRTVQKECDQFLVKYGEEVLNTLAIMSPSDVCSLMALCLSSNYRVVENATRECAMCEALGSIKSNVIKGVNVNVDRANFLMEACSHLPADRADDCSRFISRHGVRMFNALSEGVSTNVCQDLSICGKHETAKVEIKRMTSGHLIGSNKCTFGPSYWCATKENALKCGAGAMKHCQSIGVNF